MLKLLILINLMFLNFLYLFNLLGKYLLINLMILDSINFLIYLNLSIKKFFNLKSSLENFILIFFMKNLFYL